MPGDFHKMLEKKVDLREKINQIVSVAVKRERNISNKKS
jgi:hypothetical protein